MILYFLICSMNYILLNNCYKIEQGIDNAFNNYYKTPQKYECIKITNEGTQLASVEKVNCGNLMNSYKIISQEEYDQKIIENGGIK